MDFNPISLFVLLCGVITLTIAIYAWRHRSTMGAQSFSAFMFSMAIYVLSYSMELASPDVHTMLFWSKIEYIGILSFPTIFLIFAIQYTGNEKWLSRRNLILLFIVPVIFLIAKIFDDYLHFIYATATADTSGIIPLLSFTRGPLYLVIVVYNPAVVTVGVYLLFQRRRFASSLYRKQTTIILSTALVIYAVYFIYLSGVSLIPSLKELDLNPFSYSLWGAAIGLAIFRYRLFDLAPIARGALIETLGDGVIVLDPQSRVVDANPAAWKMFGWHKLPEGQFSEKLIDGVIDPEFLDSIEESKKIETHLAKDDATVYYEVTVSALKDRDGHKLGFLIMVHDISKLKEIEMELQELSLEDELTGLTNRRGFKVLATQLIGMANRMELNMVLFYMDMDQLKWINDNLGHAIGDQALKDAAAVLKNTFRSSDIIARIGGDEFVVLALESINASRETMLERLKEQLADHNAQLNGNYRLSFSIGLACYEWEKPRPMESLLEEADKAMYANKLANKDGQASLDCRS
ncbi:MAG TPA: histidine kinase N-terminal 7TM domain-containing protein [Longilinea sp.]|nr:histidine kinase N-terminal 7TM domain-containing protein [Longilinea sp.]